MKQKLLNEECWWVLTPELVLTLPPSPTPAIICWTDICKTNPSCHKTWHTEKKTVGCLRQGHPNLYLLRFHDTDRQIEGPQHNIAVAVAVMWCTLGRGGGMVDAASTLWTFSRHTCTLRVGHGGLRWGTLHQVDHLPIYILNKTRLHLITANNTMLL